MTKFRDILSIGVATIAIVTMAGQNLIATDSSDTAQKQTQKKLMKKKGKKQKHKRDASVKKKDMAPKIQKKIPVPSKEDKTPLWLKISHEPIVHPKEMNGKIGANHPFNKALAAAYNYNPQIKSKLRQYYATAEGVSQAMAEFRPSVVGTVQTGYSVGEAQNKNGSNQGVIDARSLNQKSANLSITQNLYKGSGTIAGMSAAENQVRSARADFLNTEQTILLNAAQAYLELWFQREKLKTIKISEKFYKETLQQVKAQAEVGESSTITDVAQAEFEYEKSVATRIDTEAALENAHATYIQTIGEEPSAVLTLPAPIHEMMELPSSLSILLGAVEKYNPDIIKAQYDYISSKDSVDVAAGALLPSVDLVGSADRTIDNSTRGARQNDASVFLRMTIPIYNNGGADWSSIRKSEQTASQKKHELDTARDSALKNTKQTWKNLQSNKAQIKRYEAAIKAGDIRTEGTRQEYVVGERSLLEVLQSEEVVVTARVSILEERRDYIFNGYTLISTLGELTPEILQLAVASYDVDTYPETVRDQWLGWDKTEPLRKRGAGR